MSFLCGTAVKNPLANAGDAGRLVIAFLLGGKFILISWLQSPPVVILESKKIKSVIVSPSI